MFSWGILSTAKIGREQVIPALLDANDMNVSAIASRDLERAQNLAQRFQVPKAYGSYEALLADPEIDAVYIPLPTSDHVEWTIKAAQAGKHVLCEKPIAITADQIAELINVRKETGVLISEAFMVTYNPQWMKIRELIQDGAIGQLRHVQGVFTYHNLDPQNMRNQVSLGGGALPDIGVYPTVTTRFATGAEPVRLRSEVEFSSEFGTDTYANVTAEFDGFTAAFYVSTQLALNQEMVFHGDKGRITVAAPFNSGGYDFAQVTLRNVDNSIGEIFRFADTRQYRAQAEAFVKAVEDRSHPHFTLENSLANQRVIDAIYTAGKSGDWVNL